jgi:predicted acylesterase/phospholipase RssA
MSWDWLRPAPLDAQRQPPAGRYCDLVLTGGVTDGIVYPWAVIELAREYRLKNIGGTSVGAMAAALAAAAEYGRRYGRLNGFNKILLEVPERLAEDIDGKNGKGRTRIFSLFQPAVQTKRIFNLFVTLIGSGRFPFEGTAAAPDTGVKFRESDTLSAARRGGVPWRKDLARLFAVCRLYWKHSLAGATLGAGGFVLAVQCGVTAWVLLLALPAVVLCVGSLIAYAVYRDLAGPVVDHHFGMCTGHHATGFPAEEPSLIEWLHEGIQAAAGKPLDQPLTFKDLWEAPGGPSIETPLPPSRQRNVRSIDLRTITTNLTHARPYEFPQTDDDAELYFEPAELRNFFPAAVVDYLEQVADRVPREPSLRKLPKDRLPVIIAARLSLSFPLLFSAVPLWAIDHERSVNLREYTRCRFSDGGICSNFPIHLFDAAVPEWPTFGISLRPKTPYHQTVWLPNRHYEGRHDDWYRFDEEESLAGFLASVAYSAKDWNDKISMRMPGVRDRVVHIALNAGGSLNLKLTAEDMQKLAMRGQEAGERLMAKFIDANGNRPSPMWDEHRWVRFHTFLSGLRDRIELIREAAGLTRYGKPLSRQIADAEHMPPLSGRGARTLSPSEAMDLAALLSALEDLEAQLATAALPQPYNPVPKPSLHIRAPL